MRLMLIVALLAASSATAQIVSGTIVGNIFDESGAVVTRAELILRNQQTGATRTTSVNESGFFAFPELQPGAYHLTATAAGFSVYEITGIVALVDQTARADVHLQVGAVNQAVQVTSAGAQVQSETSSLGQVIDRERVVQLPLNGRNFMQLANISSGVAPAYTARSATIANNSDRSDLAVHVSGGRGDGNSFLIDGVETRSAWFNSPSVLLSIDAIQEFKIERNMFSAEYGQGAGVVSLVSKSGSNSFHGSAYEFFRNDHLGAANFFDNFFGRGKAPLKQNQYGLTAGGPAIKNKLFFFGSWESLRSRQSSTLSALVPTAAQLAGNLNGLPSTKKNGAGQSVIIDPSSGAPFPNNQLPASRISSVTSKFVQYTPAPNASVGNQNFVAQKSTNRNDDQWTARLDYQISANDSLFGRYTNFDSSLYQPGIGVLAGKYFPYSGKNAVVQYTHILSPRLLNVFKFGYTWSNAANSWERTPSSVDNALGISISEPPQDYGLPVMGVTGGFYVGGGSNVNQGGVDHLAQFSDTVSWIHDRHHFSFGGDFRILYFDEGIGLNNNGAFTFDGRYTGSSVADFLLGDLAAESAQIGLGLVYWRSRSYNLFVQDDWKITPRLTLNLGLRYEYDSPFAEKDHLEGYFNTSTGRYVVGVSEQKAPNPLNIPQVEYDPNLRPGIWAPVRDDFAPRVGFAYRLGSNTALRGGYGIFYDKTQGNELQFKVTGPPLVFSLALTGDINAPNLNWDRDAFPNPASPNFPASGLASDSIDPSDRTPYIQQWNFGVERSLGKNNILEVSYVGSKGTRLVERVNVNQGVLLNPASPLPLQARRPFPNFGDVASTNWRENSSYNALQTRFERRFSGGVSFLGAYTWGHSIDTASRGSGGSVHQNSYALGADRGSSDFDVRHRLSNSLVYELPFGHGKRYLSSLGPFANRLVDGWSANIIATFMTGNYYPVTVAGDRANVGGGSIERANRSCNGNLPHGSRTIYHYFDTSCFSVTPLGTFGNSGRNVIQVPGLNNWDTAFIKLTPITERVRMQLRGEFFNMFNHPQFQLPDLTAGDVNLGQITSAYAPRVIQVALKLLW